MSQRLLVWDLPVRLFHWTLALLVVFSFTTGKIGGAWMDWHLKSGYAILALLVFRFSWGLVGSDTARFRSFLHGPRAAIAYARATLGGRRPNVLGHNPLGGWMVLLMLAVLAVQAATGLFSDDEIATQGPLAVKVSNAVVSRMSAIHSVNEWMVAALVALHIAAVVIYRVVLRENLVAAMVHGHMTVQERIAHLPRQRHAALAATLFALSCAAVYYLVVVFPRAPSP
jgi:cytochrome b